MRRTLLGLAVTSIALYGSGAYAAGSGEGRTLEKVLKCNACHSLSKEKDGPAYKDTAAKYKGKAGVTDQITKAIMVKKDHPELKVAAKEADVKKVVEWILAQ